MAKAALLPQLYEAVAAGAGALWPIRSTVTRRDLNKRYRHRRRHRLCYGPKWHRVALVRCRYVATLGGADCLDMEGWCTLFTTPLRCAGERVIHDEPHGLATLCYACAYDIRVWTSIYLMQLPAHTAPWLLPTPAPAPHGSVCTTGGDRCEPRPCDDARESTEISDLANEIQIAHTTRPQHRRHRTLSDL